MAAATTSTDTPSVLSRILGEADDMPERPPEMAHEPAQEAEPDTLTSDSSDTEPSALIKFMRDPDSIELFIIEMVPHTNSLGEFATAQAVKILREQFGFPHVEYGKDKSAWNAPYNTLWRLATAGRLEKLAFGYRIPQPVLDRLRGVEAVEPEAAKPALAAPVVEPSSAEEPAVSKPKVSTKASALLAEFTVLEKSAEQLRYARHDLSERRAELASIPTKVEELQRRQQLLEVEIASLTEAVNDPEALEAEQVCEAIKKMHGWN